MMRSWYVNNGVSNLRAVKFCLQAFQQPNKVGCWHNVGISLHRQGRPLFPGYSVDAAMSASIVFSLNGALNGKGGLHDTFPKEDHSTLKVINPNIVQYGRYCTTDADCEKFSESTCGSASGSGQQIQICGGSRFAQLNTMPPLSPVEGFAYHVDNGMKLKMI